MNQIERQLRRDARAIEAAVPEALTARIRAALARESAGNRVRRGGFLPPRLVAAAAASFVLVIAGLVWFNRPPPHEEAAQPVAAELAPLDGYQAAVTQLSFAVDRGMLPEADLQQELDHLNSDLQKIRSRVRRQLDPLL